MTTQLTPEAIQKIILDADDRTAEILQKLLGRLTGNIMNLFEMILTHKPQLEATKKQLQKTLAQIVTSNMRAELRANLAHIAASCGYAIKFSPLDDKRDTDI